MKAFGPAVTQSRGNLFVETYCTDNEVQSGVKGFGSGWTLQEIILKDGVASHFANGTLLESLHLAFDTAAAGGYMRLGVEHSGSMRVSMDVAEILVYNRALEAHERVAVLQYFQARYFGVVSMENPHGEGASELPDALKSTAAPIGGGKQDDLEEPTTQEVGEVFHGTFAEKIPGLTFHLDASLGVSILDKKVTVWNDLSVGDSNLYTFGGAPSLQVRALNGNNYVRLANGAWLGNNDAAALPSGISDRSVYMLVRYNSAGWGGFTWGVADCLNAFGPTVTATAGNLFVESYCTDDVVQSGVKGAGVGWTIQEIILKDGATFHYANGTLIETYRLAHNTLASGEIRLGSEHAGNSFVNMDVAEVIIYNRALSSSERITVIEYFRARFFDGQRFQTPAGILTTQAPAADTVSSSSSSSKAVVEATGEPVTVELEICVGKVTNLGKPCACSASCYACELPTDGEFGTCLQCRDSQYLSFGACVAECRDSETPSGSSVFGRVCLPYTSASSNNIDEGNQGSAPSASSSSSSSVTIVGEFTIKRENWG